jgi:hypothetical protein
MKKWRVASGRSSRVQDSRVQKRTKRAKITQRRRERGVSAEKKKEGHDISCPTIRSTSRERAQTRDSDMKAPLKVQIGTR